MIVNYFSGAVLLCFSLIVIPRAMAQEKRPNILFVINDDQSWLHTGFAGCEWIQTPAFDRIAKEGVYFSNCFAGSPGCAPSRSAIVTGRHHWQNEQAGQHAAEWPEKFIPMVDALSAHGYHTGYTGKGVGPFKYGAPFREMNAAGKAYNQVQYDDGATDERPADGIGRTNYFENFKHFLSIRRNDQPFFFWFGATEPHRPYEPGSGINSGMDPDKIELPAFYPESDVIREDLLDYGLEIQWADLHLQRMIDHLESIGELDNTVIIVTADNGMPFPRAKALGYNYGIHVPMAIRYPNRFPGGRIVDAAIGFADLAPTIFDIIGTPAEGMFSMSGTSFLPLLTGARANRKSNRRYAFSGRERHSSSRYRNWGYPQRIVTDGAYLFVLNLKPERWPAGAPQRLKDNDAGVFPLYGLDEDGRHHSEWAFTDVDESPTKAFLVEHHNDETMRPFFAWSFDKLPKEMLFDLNDDPDCMNNLVDDPRHARARNRLKKILMKELVRTKDPRITGVDPEVFDSYRRFSPMRNFPRPINLD